jgi:hypothetical protein
MQRRGKNHGGYRGETIDIRAVLRDLETAAGEHGWSAECFHARDDFRWLAFHRAPSRTAPHAPRIYLSAGIHGDEPAAPLAALQLLREDRWPDSVELFLCPCLNPTGFVANQRENSAGIDLNRDYLHLESPEIRAHVAWLEQRPAFDLCLCLHEDWEAHGFYVYELNPDRQPSLAEAVIAGVTPVCPIDPSAIIEGREARGGIIRPSLDPRTRPQWPEAFWLLTHKTRLSYTLEAPSDFPLEVRVKALVNGVQAALACRLLNWAPAD